MKEFKLTTDDIQYLTIALIYAESGNRAATLPPEWTLKAEEALHALNMACNQGNGYKLTVTVTEH